MASTAHKTKEEVEEHLDAPDDIERKIDQLADWVKSSKYFIAFTGAGVSTSAGIPDFRGPDGVWTRAARGDTVVHGRDFILARPTDGHMAILSLWNHGILKSLLSTNTDGLHLRSGFPRSCLTELHGNTNLEECPAEPVGSSEAPYAGDGCGAEFFRDERVRAEGLTAHQHATGRRCESCGKPLQDTVINFNENLRRRNVDAGREEARSCDLMLCLGSSLRVSTWAPEQVAKARGKRLVIVNLQWTPLDEFADLKINAHTDTVLAGLCVRLHVKVEPWQIRRRVVVDIAPTNLEILTTKQLKATWARESGGKGFLLEKKDMCASLSAAWASKGIDHQMLVVSASDDSGKVPYAFLKRLEVAIDGHKIEDGTSELTSLQHKAFLPIGVAKPPARCSLTIHTPGRYGEPPVVVDHVLSTRRDMAYSLVFSQDGWTVNPVKEPDDVVTYSDTSVAASRDSQVGIAPLPEDGFSEPDRYAEHPWSDLMFRVHGLPADTELNGKSARVLDFAKEASSYHVSVQGSAHLIPVTNLQVLGKGEAIQIEDLVDDEDLNGKQARVIEFSTKKGRYIVELQGGKKVLLPNRCVNPL